MKKIGLSRLFGCFVALAAVCASGVLWADGGTAPKSAWVFRDGLLGKIRPEGHLKAFCETQRAGMTGHPKALSYPYDTCLWAGSIQRKGDHGEHWWRYEQAAIYTDGFLKLGYLLDDRELIEKGEKGIDYTIDHAQPNGEMGDPCLWDASKYELACGYETWPMTFFFRAMKAKYEVTGDPRIPAALTKYYLCHTDEFLARGDRNLASVEGIVWTYDRTGDARLIDLVRRAWARIEGPFGEKGLDSDEAVYEHGVTYCERVKIPAILAAGTGDRRLLAKAEHALDNLLRHHLLPDGTISSTETTRGNSTYWGHETCTVSDLSWVFGYYLEATGKAIYADRIERCVFNAGLGSVTKDFKALQYFSNLNQFIATDTSNPNILFYGSTWSQYRPTHMTECCAGNVNRFMPNYISRMWLQDAQGNPVAALYGPSRVDYGFVKISEETDYPYDGRIRFRFAMPEPREFTFTYRVPGWCTARADRGRFVSVTRRFKDGDTMDLDFPMEPVFEDVAPRRYVFRDTFAGYTADVPGPSVSQGTVLRRGPLLFALPIRARMEEDTKEHENFHGKKSGEPDFKCWNMYPDSPFNYALAEKRAEVKTNPLRISVPVRRIRWELRENRFTPDQPEKLEFLGDETEHVELVPYGQTTLRLSVFPFAGHY